MNTKRVNAAADVIHRAMQQGKTLPISLATALESTCMLQSPETAAEEKTLRARVAELEAERHSTNEALSDAAEQMRRDRDRIAELEAQLLAVQEPENPFRPCGCPKRFDRHAWGCPTVPEDRHESELHHDYALGRDLPVLPQQLNRRAL
ncbi:hypothetical protein [Streptomyces gardneri]|uniref:hypothetical protein n=1 Tax=Streptomyces gardneri TaxID=66892 RepID=UPI003402530B